MRLDTKSLNRAIRRAAAASKKTKRTLCTQAARGFVKDIVAITPPSSSKAKGTAAKKAGENAVLGDVLKLAQPVYVDGGSRRVRQLLASASDLLAAHERARSGSKGRVNPRNRKEKLFVSQRDVLKVIKLLQGRVGWLADGWVPAALNLGVSLPAWIKRHTGAPGDFHQIDTAFRFRLELSNSVRFVGNVADYNRRVSASVVMQQGKMQRQAEFLERKALRESGW